MYDHSSPEAEDAAARMFGVNGEISEKSVDLVLTYDESNIEEDAAAERVWHERRSRQYLRALHDPQEWEDWMDEWEEEND